MRTKLDLITSEADYEHALVELERLWGTDSGTAAGDRLDLLGRLIDAYEAEHDPFDPRRSHRGDQVPDGAGRPDPQVT